VQQQWATPNRAAYDHAPESIAANEGNDFM